MKVSRLGKPLCCRCRKLAISIQTGGYHYVLSADSIVTEVQSLRVAYCADHHRDLAIKSGYQVGDLYIPVSQRKISA